MLDSQRIVPAGEFLDRKLERADLLGLVRARHNVLLYGPRRLGKTSLIHRVAGDWKEATFLFVDCNFVTAEDDLSHQVLRAISGSGLGRMRRFGDWAKQAAQGLEIAVTFGDTITFAVRRGTARIRPLEDALEFTTRIARAAKRPVVLVLDEFQHVMKSLPDAIAKLRDHAQTQRDVSYVVSGSQQSILVGLTRHKNPFWRQLTEVALGPIDVDQVVKDWERKTGKPIAPGAVEVLRDVSRGTTQRLVEILAEAEARSTGYSEAGIRSAVAFVLARGNGGFERILGSCTPYQKRLLIAIAVDEPKHPTSNAFIERHTLKGASNIQRGLDSLRRDEILEADNRFADPLFARWLKANNPTQ